MSSNTDRDKEVEKIEKLLDKYKNHIILRVDVLENNQKPKVSSEKGVIYFLKSQLEPDYV